MKHLLFVVIAFFTVHACAPAVSTPEPSVNTPDHTVDQSEPGYVPGGYLQFCADFPQSVVCEAEVK